MQRHDSGPMNGRLATLRGSYAAGLPEKLARLQEIGREAAGYGDWSAVCPLLEELRASTHMLAGSAPTFGFQDIGNMARTAERTAIRLLENNALPVRSQLAELEGILAVMAGAVNQPVVKGITRRLVVIADSNNPGRSLARELERLGYAVSLVGNNEEASRLPGDMPIYAIMVEVGASEASNLESLALLRQCRQTDIPTLFFGDSGDFGAHYAAARAGAVGYWQDTLAMPDLAQRLDGLAVEGSFRPYRVLSVGDGLPLLDGAGLSVRTVSDPAMLLIEIEQFRPELLLLDMGLTTHDAVDLARMVWQQDQYQDIGIFLASASPSVGPTLLAHGVTDAYCFSGPLDPVSIQWRIVRYLHECRAGLRPANKADFAGHLTRIGKLDLCGLTRPEARVTRAHPAVTPAVGQPRPKVLIVDDDRYLVSFLAGALAERGMDVLRAYSGEQGYNIAWQEMPRAIISDVEMPNGTGDRMILQLRGNPRTRAIPVIIMTGRRWEDGRDYALERELRGRLGAASYLQKPIELDILVKELARL